MAVSKSTKGCQIKEGKSLLLYFVFVCELKAQKPLIGDSYNKADWDTKN